MQLPPALRKQLEREYLTQEIELNEARRRGLLPPPSFQDTIKQLNPTLLDHEHIRKLAGVGDRIVTGDLTRVLVLAPPRYWKSEVFSRLLPAHNLRVNLRETVALITYGDTLSLELSEEARENYQAAGGQLKPGTEAKSRWATVDDGRLWAAGIGGRYLGKGFNLGIIDDPVDPEQAVSLAYQRRFERFWPGKFLSRQEPGARIVLVMQRLGETDPIDFLLRREVGENTEKAPQNWHVVVLDEIHSDAPLGRWDGPRGLPSTCTLEPDWRELGEVLAPERFSPEEVKRHQASAGSLVTAAQRQQRPTAPTGDFWRLDWFRTYKTLPPTAYNGGKDWDTAYTAKEHNAASAYVESYRGPGPEGEFPIYIQDVDFSHKEFPELVAWMRTTGGPHYIEQKATGKSAAQALRKEGLSVSEVGVKGDKLARASAAQPAVANRRVFIRQEVFDQLLRAQGQGLLNVTAEALQEDGGRLDVNDAFVQALWRHLELAETKAKRRARWR